jgi:hypothetical protein
MTPPRSAAVIASLVGPPKDEDDRLVSRRICFSARRRRRSCRHCAPRSGCCDWSQRLRSNTAGYATAEEIYRVVKVVLQVRFAAVLSRTNGSVTSLPTRHRDATTSMLRIQAAIALAASRHPNLCDFVAFKYSVARCSKTLEWFNFSQKRRTALTFCFHAIPDRKPLRTFPGVALKRVAIFHNRLSRFRSLFLCMSLSQNRGILLRDML